MNEDWRLKNDNDEKEESRRQGTVPRVPLAPDETKDK